MKRITLKAGNRALRVIVASAALSASLITPITARADDAIGIVMSASPTGAAASALSMRIPAESQRATIPMFVHQTTDKMLYSVRFSATPLVDEAGVASVTPTFDREKRTIPNDGSLVRFDVSVSGLKRLGTFSSRLYARHGGRTQTLGRLTVVHTLRSHELQIESIDPSQTDQAFPTASTRVVLLMTVRNSGDTDLSFSQPVIERMTISGSTKSQADVPAVRITEQDGRPVTGPMKVAAGGSRTLKVILQGLKRTGDYVGTLRISATGHDPVEQSFAFAIKQGPVFPAILIAFGVAIAYGLRRAYSSRRIGRAGQKRVVARLLSDLSSARTNAGDLEPREALIVETLERRLADVSDELELSRIGRNIGVLSEIDLKIDLFADLVTVRRHVRSMTPVSMQSAFDPQLDEVAAFLTEATTPRDLVTRFNALSDNIAGIPKAVEATVRERFQRDVERLLAAVDGSAVSATLPLAVLSRVSDGRELADEGRLKEARTVLASAQRTFARLLAEDLAARMPDADSGPPGFVVGWPKFRGATLDGLRAVRRERRGEHAAEAYRRVWQDYVAELITRLRSAAARERRRSTPARKEQLSKVIEACDEAMTMAMVFDPATVDAYRRAVEGYLAPVGQKRSTARFRSMVAEAQFPPPLTVVAAGLGDAESMPRPSPSGTQSAAALTRRIRKRQWSLALAAGVAAIPAGLVLLWAPNDTWGSLTDGAAVFGWGVGLVALSSMLDARRLGWAVSRDARTAQRRVAGEAPAPVGSPRVMQPEREPAG